MAYMHTFDAGDGSTVQLNSAQLKALLSIPSNPTVINFQTYWALRNRKLIDGSQNYLPRTLTARGEAVLRHYREQHGSQT